MSTHTATALTGSLNELGAIRFLTNKFPEYKWELTENWDNNDLKGIDIIGNSPHQDLRLVQVKSSQYHAEAWVNRQSDLLRYVGSEMAFLEILYVENSGEWAFL